MSCCLFDRKGYMFEADSDPIVDELFAKLTPIFVAGLLSLAL